MTESGPDPQVAASLCELAAHTVHLCPGPFWGSAGDKVSPGGSVLLFLLLIRVTTDGDDADRGAGGVGNDDGLPLPLPGGAGGPVAPATGDSRAAGRAAVHQGAAGRRVLLDALGPLRGADGLRGGHLTGGDISAMRKPRTLMEEGQRSSIFQGANCLEAPALQTSRGKSEAGALRLNL